MFAPRRFRRGMPPLRSKKQRTSVRAVTVALRGALPSSLSRDRSPRSGLRAEGFGPYCPCG